MPAKEDVSQWLSFVSIAISLVALFWTYRSHRVAASALVMNRPFLECSARDNLGLFRWALAGSNAGQFLVNNVRVKSPPGALIHLPGYTTNAYGEPIPTSVVMPGGPSLDFPPQCIGISPGGLPVELEFSLALRSSSSKRQMRIVLTWK